MTDDVLSAALAWREAGVSVIPIKSGGQKKPLIQWKNGEINYQQEIASEQQVREWFTGTDHGLAIICGAVSDNIEMFEIEGRVYDGKHEDERHRVNEALRQAGVEDAFEYLLKGYCEQTPSGGMHLMYYVEGGDVPGNMKIANEPAVDDAGNSVSLTLVETRGEGGYVIVAPTGGHCHSTGRPWSLMAGQPGLLPSIDVATRDRIHGAFHSVFDKTIEMPAPPQREHDTGAVGERPGDQWAAQTPWRDVLEPEGWEYSHSQGDSYFWTRPGKDRRQGISAATREDGNLYVWSSSAGLPTEQPLSKFYVYAHYNHGSLENAAAALRKLGFGVDRPMGPDPFFNDYPKDTPPAPAGKTDPAVVKFDGTTVRCGTLRATPASAFKIKRVRWLWEDWIPLGQMTLIPGREGVGKSLLLAALAADITRGRLAGEFFGEPRAVFYVASEDSWEQTIAPRMIAARADMSLIHRIDVVEAEGRQHGSAPMLPTDCENLGQLALGLNAAALMLDPIVSLVDSHYDTYKAPDLRKVLEPLRNVAEVADLSILALVHFNKNTSGDTSSKIAGSRAWTEVARSAIAIARMPHEEFDEEDPEQFFQERENRVVVSLIKNNLGRLDRPNRTYIISSEEIEAEDGSKTSVGVIEWGEDSPMSADQILSNSDSKKRPTEGSTGKAADITAFIKDEWAEHGMVVSTQELVNAFPDMKPETVRAYLSRLVKNAKIERTAYGCYKPL